MGELLNETKSSRDLGTRKIKSRLDIHIDDTDKIVAQKDLFREDVLPLEKGDAHVRLLEERMRRDVSAVHVILKKL